MDIGRGFARRALVPAILVTVAGCAAAPSPDDLSARAQQARTKEEHQSLATEYRRLAQRASIAAARDDALARGDLRVNAASSQVRGGRGHFPAVGLFDARAVMEARQAEEFSELALRHDAEARAAQATPAGSTENQSLK